MDMKVELISFAALSIALASPAAAQDTPAAQGTTSTEPSGADTSTTGPAAGQRSGGIEEIVVTAQKRAENVQDVPIAISAFTASALQERAVGNVSALSNIAPNVTLDASTPFSGSSSVLGAYIRGIGSADFAFNIDPGVGTYLDGVYLARSIGANQDLLDVERIEVLKGPQGTLFGRNTIGGAIAIATRDPAREFDFRGDVTTGSYRRMQVRGTVDIPITEQLRSSLTFGMLNRRGYQKRLTYTSPTQFVTDGYTVFPAAGYEARSRQGGDDSWSVRGKLKWDDGRNVRMTLSADYTNVDQESTASSVLLTTEFLPGPFAGLTQNNLGPAQGFPIQTGLDVVTGSSGFLFAGLYNFCIGATGAQIAARSAANLCGPRSSINGYSTLPPLAGVNVDSNPLNNRLPYDSRWINTDKDTTFANGNNFSKLKQGGVNGTVEVDVGENHTLKSITAYRFVDFSAGVDLDNSPLEFLQTSFTVDQEQFSQEVQLLGSVLDKKLNYVFGAYYFQESGDLVDYVTFAEGLLQVVGPAAIKTKNYAAFGQVDWRPIDLIGITVGARYTKERKLFEGAQGDTNGFNYKLFNCVPAGAACAPLVGFPTPSEPFRYFVTGFNKQRFNNFSPKLGIQVHPTEAVMAYGSWSRGYKTGGWTTRLSNPLPFAPTFGPEKAETWEVGIKSEMLDRQLQINAAAFTTRYDGIQLNFQQGVSPVVQNAGDARIKGFELEATAAPRGSAFSVQGSVGYVDAYYTDVLTGAQVAPNALQAGVLPGSELPKSPHWKVNVSPRFQTALASGSLTVLGDWTYTSRMRNDTEGTFILSRRSTNIFNASATWRAPGEAYEITVGGTNLSNERYLVTGQFQGAGGVVYGTYSRPAEWYARLGVKF
jgi:iron complex outermembrane receptor protein